MIGRRATVRGSRRQPSSEFTDALSVVALLATWGDVMQFQHIDVSVLIGAAGGDPWAINDSLQVGRPLQISDLASAFHNAGRCTAEASATFDQAYRRFAAAWNREGGDHPINDSAEVQRAMRSLGVQADQLPKIGADLENIAAALAEAQRSGAGLISTLDSQLREIDNELAKSISLENSGHLTVADKTLIDQHIHDLDTEAVKDTKSGVKQLQSVRSGYSNCLQKSLATLRAQDGYDPAPIQGIDADGQPTHAEQDQHAIEGYNAKQRAIDEALATSPGGLAAEKAAAAARLRDYATATNPAADADARRLAGERLGDFAMAHFNGPLPVDPVLGGDARTRAQMRLDWQKKLEQGFSGTPPMSPDQVTQMLDNGEQTALAVVTQQAVKGLISKGMSPSAAIAVAGDVSRGTPWADIVRPQGQTMTLAGAGVDGTVAARGGRHAVDAFTEADVKAFEKVGKVLGRGGTLVEVALAANDYLNGAGLGTTVGKTGGSIAGTWLGATAGGAALGSAFGPEGAFVGAILGAAIFGFAGEKAGEAVGGLFDQ